MKKCSCRHGKPRICFLWREKQKNDYYGDNKTEIGSEVLKELHKKFSIILRIIASKSYVREEFKDFCYDTYKLLVKEFSWMKLSESLHRLLAHSAEVIRMNDNQSLGQLSESPLEAQHKLVRKYRTCLARITNETDNLPDVYNRLYMRFCPVIRKQKPHKRLRGKRIVKSSDDEIIETFLY